MTNINRILVAALAGILLTACASNPPSDEAFRSAERAIDAAERAGADDLSPVELRFARERLAQARTLSEQGQNQEALMAIERSELNAALAIEHGCTWVTTDRDFARFPGLTWQHPLDHPAPITNPIP